MLPDEESECTYREWGTWKVIAASWTLEVLDIEDRPTDGIIQDEDT